MSIVFSGDAFLLPIIMEVENTSKGNITLDTTLDPHIIEAPHGGPWLSLDQARIEPLPVGAQSIPMEDTTLDQFIDALHSLVEQSCIGLSQARAHHRRQTVKAILDGLGGDDEDDLDVVQRWYLMEELEHLGIVFATSATRRKDRKCRVVVAR
jgi:hypothetical protein